MRYTSGFRSQEHVEARQEWKEVEKQMDGNPFYINFGINGIHYTKALVDSGCLCFATISLSLARRLRLPRIPITPRDLAQVNVTVKGAIREVAYADTDIDGHKLNRVFFYIIPDQEDDVVLGRPWMNAEDVTISPSRGELTIGTSGLTVKERSQAEDTTFPISQQMSITFVALVREARKAQASHAHDPTEPVQVFAASPTTKCGASVMPAAGGRTGCLIIVALPPRVLPCHECLTAPLPS